jgi:hypothetical protein
MVTPMSTATIPPLRTKPPESVNSQFEIKSPAETPGFLFAGILGPQRGPAVVINYDPAEDDEKWIPPLPSGPLSKPMPIKFGLSLSEST